VKKFLKIAQEFGDLTTISGVIFTVQIDPLSHLYCRSIWRNVLEMCHMLCSALE